MEPDQARALYGLSTQTRSLFHKLGDAAETLLGDSGITVGMRAVLENAVTRPQTVPEMARARPVSRQYIQTLVNSLMAVGLVEQADNPAHKRSKLIQATEKGRSAFAEIRTREGDAFALLALNIPASDMERAAEIMAALAAKFESPEWRGIAQTLSHKE